MKLILGTVEIGTLLFYEILSRIPDEFVSTECSIDKKRDQLDEILSSIHDIFVSSGWSTGIIW